MRIFGILQQAREWYEDTLQEEQKRNWDQLKDALKRRFGAVNNPEDLWKELSKLHQGEGEDINAYINRFEAC